MKVGEEYRRVGEARALEKAPVCNVHPFRPMLSDVCKLNFVCFEHEPHKALDVHRPILTASAIVKGP